MAHKNTIYIPIQAMVRGFASGSEASLNDISSRIAQAIKPFMQSLRLKIDPSSITNVQQLEKYLRSINATITQTANGFTIMAQSANGLQGVVSLTQREGEVLAQTTSLTAQRITITQQLQQTYDSLRGAITEKNRLEKEGLTGGEAYEQASAKVQYYSAEIEKLTATMQRRYRVQTTYNQELQKEVLAGDGAAAKIMRENEYRIRSINTIHQEEMARRAANAAKREEEASANQYLSTMNQVLSAEVRLAAMKQGGSTPQAIAAQQQYINLLRQKAMALKANITDIELLARVEEELAIAEAKANAQMQQGSVAIKKQQGLFGSLVASMRMVIKTALLYSIAYGAIYKVVEAVRETIETIKDLDKAVVDLRIVTGGTQEEAEKLLATYNKMAQQLGSTTTEVAEAAVEWQRQGYNLAETNKLIENSMILSKVGMLESAEAQQYLTSAIKGYNVAVQDSLGIVDQLTAIDLNAAVSAGGLAEAMSKTAASAKIAGVEMEQLLGYLAVVGEVTQKSMSSVGESFKTVFARFGQIKAGKFVDEETGEDLNDIAKVLSQFNIQLYDAQGNMADVGGILNTLHNQWKDLTTVEKNAIATAVAGVRQRENFLVLMENYGTAIEYTEEALNSAGTAEKKFTAYNEGIEAKLNTMKSALESLAKALIDSGFIKSIIDATTGVVRFAEKFKIIQILFVGLMAIGIPKLFMSITAGLSTASLSATRFIATQKGVTMAMSQASNATAALNALLATGNFTFANMSTTQIMTTLTTTGLIQAFRGLTTEEILNRLASMGVEEADRASIVTKIQKTLATNGETISIKALVSATWLHIKAMAKEIAMMVAAHWKIMLIVGAIALLTAGLIYASKADERLAKRIEEVTEAHEEAKNKVKETSDALKDNQQRIEELERMGSLTYVEQTELKNLRRATSELEQQLELEKEKERVAIRNEARERKKQFEDLGPVNEENFFPSGDITFTGDLPFGDSAVANASKKGAEAVEAYIKYKKILETAGSDTEVNDILQQIMDGLFPEVEKYINAYQDYIATLEQMTEQELLALLGPDYKQKVEQIKNQYQELMLNIFPEEYKKIKWDEILGMEEFEGATEKLQEWVNAGLSEEEILKKLKEAYPDLIDKLKEAGIKEEEIVDQFKKQEVTTNEVIKSFEELKSEIESIKNAYETLNSAIDEYNSNGSLSYDTWEKLLEVEDEYLSALVNENGQLKSNKQALQDLTKARVEEATIARIETYVNNLLAAAKRGDLQQVLLLTSGIQANTGARMANIMAIIASNKELAANKNQILSTIKAMLQMGSSIDMGTDSTDKATKASEEWEQVLSYANALLDDQIDKLEKQKEAIEKSIEEQIKAKEKEISLLEAEKEALEDKNEEKNKEIELEELQRNLQKANQRTMRVYREGYGWSYEKDPEALKEAQQELDEFYTEQEIDNIDKRIEALEKEVEALEKTTDEEEDTYDIRLKKLDEQIKKAEEYKKKWNNVKTEYELAQNKIVAEAKLGANAEQDILNDRTTAVNTFKTNYTLALDAVAKSTKESANRINTSLGGMISDLERLLKLQEDLQAGGNKEMLTPEQYMKTVKGGEKEKKDAKLRYTRAYEQYEKDKEKNIYTSASKWNKKKTTKITGAYTGNTYILHTNGRYILASDLVDRGDGYYDIPQGTTWYSQAYASGTLSAQSGLANVDEKGNELILPKQGRYRMMEYGDTVIPHNLSQRLLQVATNPLRFIADALNSVKSPSLMSNSNTNSTNSTINIGTIELPSVSDGQSFIKQLQLITANR